MENLSLFYSRRDKIFNTEDSTLANNGYPVGAPLLPIPFHIVFVHHSQIANVLRIIQSLLEFVQLITFTLLRSDSRLKTLGDFELSRLDKVEPSRFLSLPIDHILSLVLLFLEKISELTKCRFVDPLANLEAH